MNLRFCLLFGFSLYPLSGFLDLLYMQYVPRTSDSEVFTDESQERETITATSEFKAFVILLVSNNGAHEKSAACYL